MDLPALALAAGVIWSPVAVPVPNAVPVQAPASVYDATGAARTWAEAIADLATAKVVAVGEQHDNAAHHKLQAEILSALASIKPMAVGFEMVGYEDQPTLDAFMSGKMTEADFSVWWKKNWGYDFALYKPIFDAAKAASIPCYGLNAPIEVVKAVGKKGIAGLTAAERVRIPALIDESVDARYRNYVRDAVSGHGAPPAAVTRMIEAMSVWNETMGERVAKIAAGGKTVLVIAGEGHVLFKAGIIEGAAKRGAGPGKVLLPVDTPPQAADLANADWFRIP